MGIDIKLQQCTDYWIVQNELVGISNSRESEFPPTKSSPSVGAISESRTLPEQLEWTIYYTVKGRSQ